MPKEFTVVTEFTPGNFMVAMLDDYKKPVYMQTMTLTLGESNESHS